MKILVLLSLLLVYNNSYSNDDKDLKICMDKGAWIYDESLDKLGFCFELKSGDYKCTEVPKGYIVIKKKISNDYF